MRTKYLLVDRGEGWYEIATTQAVVTDMQKRGLVKNVRPVTLKEIKARNIHQYNEHDYFRHVATDELIEKYNGKIFEGKVRWFDATAGEGIVTLDDGQDLYVHYSAIRGVNKGNYAYPVDADMPFLQSLNKQPRVRVKAYITIGYVGVETLEVLNQEGK